MMHGDTCTPGRVSWVYFTHADIVEKLWDKPPGYMAKKGRDRMSGSK